MKTLVAIVAAVTLCGCADSWNAPEGEMTPDAGLAVRNNITAQIVNPNAPEGRGAFATDGERIFHAVDRYNKGTVKPPASASTGSKSAGTDNDAGADEKSNTP